MGRRWLQWWQRKHPNDADRIARSCRFSLACGIRGGSDVVFWSSAPLRALTVSPTDELYLACSWTSSWGWIMGVPGAPFFHHAATQAKRKKGQLVASRQVFPYPLWKLPSPGLEIPPPSPHPVCSKSFHSRLGDRHGWPPTPVGVIHLPFHAFTCLIAGPQLHSKNRLLQPSSAGTHRRVEMYARMHEHTLFRHEYSPRCCSTQQLILNLQHIIIFLLAQQVLLCSC